MIFTFQMLKDEKKPHHHTSSISFIIHSKSRKILDKNIWIPICADDAVMTSCALTWYACIYAEVNNIIRTSNGHIVLCVLNSINWMTTSIIIIKIIIVTQYNLYCNRICLTSLFDEWQTENALIKIQSSHCYDSTRLF